MIGHYYSRAAETVESPREIVARLHERIAAKSPEHAALVAGFEQRQAERRLVLADAVSRRAVPPAPSIASRRSSERIRRFAIARDAGKGREEAAAEVGVGPSAARNYDARLRAMREARDA